MARVTPNFRAQTWALLKKNFTIIIVRSWFWTAFRALVLPILLVTLLLEIPNLSRHPQQYGVGDPAPVRSLASSMDGSRRLAIIRHSDQADDAKAALDRLTAPLDKNLVVYLDSPSQVPGVCNVDFRGNSDCHAVLNIVDSPGSGRANAVWNYTLQTDPVKFGSDFRVFDHSGNTQTFWLPLQIAIDNAIANIDVVPDEMSYLTGSQEQADKKARDNFLILCSYILSFVFYISMLTVVHHLSSFMSSERGTGLSQLMDSMVGGLAWPRIFSYIIFFDLLYLPLWIVVGCLMWSLLLTHVNPAIVIFWQVLTGWSMTGATAFATAFFKRSAPATIFVVGLSFILAAVAAVVDNLRSPPTLGEVAALSFIFPSMNYIYFFTTMTRAEQYHALFQLNKPVVPAPDYRVWGLDNLKWIFHNPSYFIWIAVGLQIVVFPFLAVLVEHSFHGNNRRRRSFNNTPEDEKSHVTIETADLEMHYRPSIWRKIFCSRKPTVKAVNGLSLTSQKGQILCLLGPNGSGKTTTLDMIAGFQRPTGGSIRINALPSQIGVCPQKNVLWDNLTVYEHLVFWNTIKSGTDSNESMEQLIHTCDLGKKRNTYAKNLSGGMKRKLQLACMLVGGSSVCLLDEVTSGLDPISRRVIWNAVLKERSRRTMILTTHFLDESEVLSDHIVIVSLGKMKCQGTPAELKNQYGAGYRVHLPRNADVSGLTYPVKETADGYICRAPDSSSAARVISSIPGSVASDVFITGPTIEDVFLKISRDSDVSTDSAFEMESLHAKASEAGRPSERTALRQATILSQCRALFLKRLIILRSQWWAYLFALAIPLVVTPQLKPFLHLYEAPVCSKILSEPGSPYPARAYEIYQMAVGPQAAKDPLRLAYVNSWRGVQYLPYNYSSPVLPSFFESKTNLIQYIHDHGVNMSSAIFVDNSSSPLVVYNTGSYFNDPAAVTNLFNQVRTGIEIHISTGTLRRLEFFSLGNSIIWSTIICLVMALYPAFFCLYPTYERLSKVRALQYSNGVRALPLWLSYMLFDLMFVLVISVVSTALIAPQSDFWGLSYLWFVQFLYGIAAMLVAYIVSTFSSSQPAAMAWSILIMVVEYICSIIALVVVQDSLAFNLKTSDGITYGLGLIFPIQNLIRALSLSLNQYMVRCRGSTSSDNPGSFYAYGGPIFLLIMQIIGLFCVLLWLDGTVFGGFRSKDVRTDEENSGLSSARSDVDKETARVTASENDLLRVLHLSKKFGPKTAVEDVSFGMREGEILALLGPNGAGKTTSINMIRGEMAPSSGSVLLDGVNVHKNKRLAQSHLGVCPQFDALDLLTVREHLTFYARCKGVADIRADVDFVLSKVGMTAHQHKLAAKLSGGQKRKLSLAIALLGNPPVLLLDEPSTAMDAASKRILWRTLEAVAPGRSVMITTHSMEEADALATRAAIIARRLLAIGTTQELRKAHSNEYHVHLILKSAPLSSPDEMRGVADWVMQTFPDCNIQFEGENLGGQVRFIVPADSKVPSHIQRQGEPDHILSTTAPHDGDDKSFVRYLIEILEQDKEPLGLDCYSIGAATMERVFLSVVKDSDVDEEEDEKKPFWRWLGFSRK